MFDVRRFLQENFLNPQQTAALVKSYGFDAITLGAVEKWFARGSVPGAWWPVLLSIKEIETGRPVRVSQYLVAGGQ